MQPRHPNLLDQNQALLVVMDMQEPFLRHLHNRGQVVSRTRLLIDASKILRIPILYTTQYAKRMGGVIPEIGDYALQNTDKVIDKMMFSAAGERVFTDELLAADRNQILLCGVETHICIAQTALDLQHLGYSVHVALDAVSSRSGESHHYALSKLMHSGIMPSSAEAAIMELLQGAESEIFKQILTLIKNEAA